MELTKRLTLPSVVSKNSLGNGCLLLLPALKVGDLRIEATAASAAVATSESGADISDTRFLGVLCVDEAIDGPGDEVRLLRGGEVGSDNTRSRGSLEEREMLAGGVADNSSDE